MTCAKGEGENYGREGGVPDGVMQCFRDKQL